MVTTISVSTTQASQVVSEKTTSNHVHEVTISKEVAEIHTLNVEIVSKENIKPMTPTPVHLQTFKLSGIDQTSPPVAVSMVFFFSSSDNKHVHASHEKKLGLLKKSLSETLARFYPLSGMRDGNETIFCDNQGVDFFEAHATSTMDEVISNPQSDQLRQLLPTDNISGFGPRALLSIQINIFDCGGMAIGVSSSHKVMDASSVSFFINQWAASSRGSDDDIVFPKFDIRSFFPPRYDIPVSIYPPGKPARKLVTKRFVFSSSNLVALKAKSSDDQVGQPTRVEALSALVWRCLANIARTRAESPTSKTVLNILVNIRGKMAPALPNDVVGNMVMGTLATLTAETPQELPFLVSKLRRSIRNMDGDYVRKLQTEDGFSGFIDAYKQIEEPYAKEEVELITISSWLRFPFYAADFGWGAPAWSCSAGLPGKGIIVLMDSKVGDGVEAWVALDEPAMAQFERDPELLSFTADQ